MAMPDTSAGGTPRTVLEDPTGRRALWLRRAGRVVFVVFLGWLLAIVLGGLGLLPVAGIPLAHVLRPSPGPAPLTKLPPPRQPTASDLRPALSATQFAARAATTRRQSPATRSQGRSASAPGHSAVAPGHSAVAPGQTKTRTNGNTARKLAPGRSTTTSARTTKKPLPSAKGRSTTAPGQTTTRSTGKP